MIWALPSHQCGLGSIPALCPMWVEFVGGSCLAPRVFLRVLRFPRSTKTNISKFQFDQDRGPAWKPAKDDVASSLNIVIYWLIDCLTDWLTDWLTDYLSVWLSVWLTDCLTDWLTDYVFPLWQICLSIFFLQDVVQHSIFIKQWTTCFLLVSRLSVNLVFFAVFCYVLLLELFGIVHISL